MMFHWINHPGSRAYLREGALHTGSNVWRCCELVQLHCDQVRVGGLRKRLWYGAKSRWLEKTLTFKSSQQVDILEWEMRKEVFQELCLVIWKLMRSAYCRNAVIKLFCGRELPCLMLFHIIPAFTNWALWALAGWCHLHSQACHLRQMAGW